MSDERRERGICELYQDDPQHADWAIFGRVPDSNRRGFLKGAGLATMGAVLGATIPLHRNMPSGLIPAALAQSTKDFKIAGKDGLTVYNDRPVNAETPAHLLDDDVTPNARHFIRNNGAVPEAAMKMDASGWKMVLDGEVEKPLTLTLDDLRSGKFEIVKRALQIECGGNGRSGFNPPASGNQWTVGAVGNAMWTGVRLADVLKAAGVKPGAVYTGHEGADPHLSGDPTKVSISRGVPIAKAMDANNLIAFEMNAEPIPAYNGFPVRLVIPGWPGSCSQKWLTRVWVRDKVHDGEKMGGMSYRIPKYNVAPGTKVPKEDFKIMESMPVKSVITAPMDGIEGVGREVEVRGHAWAGDRKVAAIHVSIDFGATWTKADLSAPPNPYSWQRWRARLAFPERGYYEVWARATDDKGVMQPFAVNWNPRGYMNNSMHRIALTVA